MRKIFFVSAAPYWRSNIPHSAALAFREALFQYKYPGTPISTMAAPAIASFGRVMIVFKVHAAPAMT